MYFEIDERLINSARKYISIQSLYSFFIAVKWWVGSLQRVLKCNLYTLFPSMFSVSIVDSTQKKILRKEKSKPRALWCSSICCGLTRLRLMSPQHFDHCDDANRVVDKSTDHAKPHLICFLTTTWNIYDKEIIICLDKWKHRFGPESARTALCKWTACTRQAFLSNFYAPVKVNAMNLWLKLSLK